MKSSTIQRLVMPGHTAFCYKVALFWVWVQFNWSSTLVVKIIYTVFYNNVRRNCIGSRNHKSCRTNLETKILYWFLSNSFLKTDNICSYNPMFYLMLSPNVFDPVTFEQFFFHISEQAKGAWRFLDFFLIFPFIFSINETFSRRVFLVSCTIILRSKNNHM